MLFLELYGLWEQLLTYKIWRQNYQTINTLHQSKKGLAQEILHARGRRIKTKDVNTSNIGVKVMGKLCPRGKAAAKRKFKVYPSAYANMYASAVCSGKVTPGGKKNKKAAGGMIESNKLSQQRKAVSKFNKGGIARGCGAVAENKRKKTKYS